MCQALCQKLYIVPLNSDKNSIEVDTVIFCLGISMLTCKSQLVWLLKYTFLGLYPGDFICGEA